MAQTTVETTGQALPPGPARTDFTPRLVDWTAAWLVAEKELRVSLRYPANFIAWAVMPILWQAPMILMAVAIGGDLTHFTELSGFSDFVRFTVIGWFVASYLDNSIWAVGNNFRWEQFGGTLESLFCAPVPRVSLMLGAAVASTVTATIEATLMLAFACGVFGTGYAISTIGPVIVVLIAMIVALHGLSFMLAGIIIVFKDPSVLTEFVATVTRVLTPISYPVSALPRWARWVAYLMPSALALVAIRYFAISGTFDVVIFLQTLVGLGLLSVFFWSVGLVTFRAAERWTRDRGHIGGF